MNIQFDTIERATADIAAGKPAMAIDDENPDSDGALIFAADAATPELVAFMVRYSCGYLSVPMASVHADRLGLRTYPQSNSGAGAAEFAMAVDARNGVTTGASAADRAQTIRRLADPQVTAADFRSPGHVSPLRVHPDGVLHWHAHPETALDLVTLSGRHSVAVMSEVTSQNDPTRMARAEELRAFADEHDLALVSMSDLIAYRCRVDKLVDRVVSARVPLPPGEFTAVGYRSHTDEREHVAFVLGDVADADDVLVRIHLECMTGDVFGSLRCVCRPQLHAALAAIAREGRGVLLYMRRPEGRGNIGLMHKLTAYQLQETGGVIDPTLELGRPVEPRDYGAAAQILMDLGVNTVRLMWNSNGKRSGLERYGLRVAGHAPLPMRFDINGVPDPLAEADLVGEDPL